MEKTMEEMRFNIQHDVQQAMNFGLPIVALESTVITHGLPQPVNLQLARDMEATVRAQDATPATIALMDGSVRVGLSSEELEKLAGADNPHKVSLRDFGYALEKRLTGGTTVAATMFVAEKVGIKVFATGGIGGVHRNAPFDVSADLMQLSRCPVLVVCAGAKAILDLPATMEYLETQGVPVIGYQTNDFPAFYSISSGMKLNMRADSAEEVAKIAETHWSLGLKLGILLVVPPPKETAIPAKEVERWVEEALRQAELKGIHGNATTPYLLAKVSALSGGRSMETNIALLLNNAKVAAQVAGFMRPKSSPQLSAREI
jgi:pseudouridine-5'-phosphate glycosidase